MNTNEYSQKLSQCKTNTERDSLNNKFLNSKIKSNKQKRFYKFCKNNILGIIDLIIGLVGVVLAFISLFK